MAVCGAMLHDHGRRFTPSHARCHRHAPPHGRIVRHATITAVTTRRHARGHRHTRPLSRCHRHTPPHGRLQRHAKCSRPSLHAATLAAIATRRRHVTRRSAAQHGPYVACTSVRSVVTTVLSVLVAGSVLYGCTVSRDHCTVRYGLMCESLCPSVSEAVPRTATPSHLSNF